MGKQPTNKNKGNIVGLFLMVLAAVITIIIAFPVTDGVLQVHIQPQIKVLAVM